MAPTPDVIDTNPSGWLTRVRNAAPPSAILPVEYARAVAALETCDRIDSCKDWADKAGALASYAKQAKDDTLHTLATRIKARAVRRCGELLQTFQSNGGRPTIQKTSMGAHASFPRTQREAAENAGLSRNQEDTAVRVAKVPAADFEAMVESAHPPTVSALKAAGKTPTPIPFAHGKSDATPLRPTIRTAWREGFAQVQKRDPALAAAMEASPNQHGVQTVCSAAGLMAGHLPRVWQFRERLDPERFIALAAAVAVRPRNKWCEYLAGLPTVLFERGVELAIAGTLTDALEQRRPIPSQFYPGIDPSLDAWLLKEQRETDHELLEPLSRVDGWARQRAFVERYLTQGRAHAEATITIPDYKWLLVNGTEDDRQIWQFLRVCHTYFKLGPDAMNILTGALHRMGDKAKWLRVLDSYTSALTRGEVIDVATAPWEHDPK